MRPDLGERSRWTSVVQLALLVVLASLGLTVRQATSDPCPDARFGCVVLDPGEPIVLGTLLVTSEEHASLGQDSQRGAILAMEERGPVLGHRVISRHQDDGCDAAGGSLGASRLARVPDLVAVIGTSCSRAAVPAARILSRHGILLVSPSNTGPQMTAPGSHQPFYARTAHNDRIQADAMAVFGREELEARTAVTVTDGAPYPDLLVERFTARFRALGGLVTHGVEVPPSVSVERALTILEQVGSPDLLYMPLFVEEGAAVVRAARSVPALAGAELTAADGVFTPDFLQLVGFDNTEGIYVSGPELLPFQEDATYRAFVSRYEDRFDEEPSSVFHAHAYDAANMVLDAVEAVAVRDHDGRLLIPRAPLRDSLLGSRGTVGLTGVLVCDRFGDCGAPTSVIVRELTDHGPSWRVSPAGDIGPGPGTF